MVVDALTDGQTGDIENNMDVLVTKFPSRRATEALISATTRDGSSRSETMTLAPSAASDLAYVSPRPELRQLRWRLYLSVYSSLSP